ncbi:MAG: PKD domain-containing protein, partial [Vicinamibacterales bacterium]
MGATQLGVATMRNTWKRWVTQGGLIALALSLLASVATAETLLMPKRDGLKNASMVVWGVSTLPNGTAFSLDYGDATAPTVGNVGDRSYINFNHTYAAAGNYDVTLTVGAESATVRVQIFDSALLTADQLRSLKINMAIEDGLRYFWQGQAGRAGNFPANVQTNWGGDLTADTALIVLAFENHGYTLSGNTAPTGVYEKYIVRRGLNALMGSLAQVSIGVQAAGNPCVGSGAGWVGSDCVALTAVNDPGYSTAVAILPFAASGALSRVNTEVAGVTANKTFGEILQRLVNAEAWGQSDSNCGAGRGGFGYSHNGCQFDGSTVGWSVLGFLDAEAAGAVVPAFVRTEFAFGFNNALNTDGSFDYSADGSPNSVSSPGVQKVGIGLQGLFFLSDTGARVNLVKNNISSWWEGGPGIGQNNWSCNNPVS